MSQPASLWLGRVDAFLKQISWDRTWADISRLIEPTINVKAHSYGVSNAALAKQRQAFGITESI
jgi:hypothetical protein